MTEKLGYSIQQVSEITGIGRTKIYSEIGAGKLIARKLGRRTIIIKVDLERWLQHFPVIRPEQSIAAETPPTRTQD